VPTDRRLPVVVQVVDLGDLELRPFVPRDVDTLIQVFADPEVKRWNPGPTEDEDGTEWVEEWLRRRNDWKAGGHFSWAVGGAGGALLGSVSLHQVDLDQQDAEIGYWVVPWARGRGIAGRAVAAAVDFAFDRAGLRRVYLYHATANVASCRIADRCGFTHEGTLRRSHRYGDGEYHDEHLHGLLVTDPRQG
jgi:RimJ/RimL family protein N-acetyltransferase